MIGKVMILMTPEILCNAVKTADRGQFIAYYRGMLCTYRDWRVVLLSEVVMILEEEKLIIPVQKKIEFFNYTYYAVRTKNPFSMPKKIPAIILAWESGKKKWPS